MKTVKSTTRIRKNRLNPWLISLAILFGLAANGYFIGRALERFKTADRVISVKGFAEREVMANLAVWTIKTRVTTNDISAGSRDIERSKTKIIDFLVKNGFSADSIVQNNLSVTDKLAREYGPSEIGSFRYIIENSVQLRTANVELVSKVSRQTDELLKVGIIVSGQHDYSPAVQYLFTGLNNIKPQMLAEATQNARQAAQEFATQSSVKLGSLRKANQGLFTIVDRDAFLTSQSGEGGYYQANTNDIVKKVRVVVNVEYALK